MELELEEFVTDFALGLECADSRAPVAVNRRSKKPFRPGIGPHSEPDTIELVGLELKSLRPAAYGERWHTGVPYGNGTRTECDVCLGRSPSWDWAIEVKMLRLLGDNGKVDDSALKRILSPYPAHRSALTDVGKLLSSNLGRRRAVLVFGYDHEDWPMDPTVEAFELLVRNRYSIGSRHEACFGGLVHPVHREGRVFAWELLGGQAAKPRPTKVGKLGS